MYDVFIRRTILLFMLIAAPKYHRPSCVLTLGMHTRLDLDLLKRIFSLQLIPEISNLDDYS